MAMPSTDFLTKQQMRGSIALPKVGVKYSDGAGGVSSFGVSDASDLGSLDAAFAAAAAGVRHGPDNFHLAQMIVSGKNGSIKNGSDKKISSGSGAIKVKDGEDRATISLKGDGAGSKRVSAFYGKDVGGAYGFHGIDRIDEPKKGTLVGKTQNTKAEADSNKRDVKPSKDGPSAWSFETSRTAYKVDTDNGTISYYNYFRTVYVSEIGRIVGMSEEKEVLVFTQKTKIDETYLFCAKPETETIGEEKVVKRVLFGKPTYFRIIDKGPAVVAELQSAYDLIKNDPRYDDKDKAYLYNELNEMKELLRNAEKNIVSFDVGKFSVKGEFSDGVLSKLLFGTQADIEYHADDTSKVKTVETVEGCPYQS